MRLTFYLFFLLIYGCSVTPTQIDVAVKLDASKNIPKLPSLESESFGKPSLIIPVEEVYKLSASQKQHFLEKFYSDEYLSEYPNKRIFMYLEDNLDQFNYFSGTYIASEALSINSGNCLSLAIITKALADLVNIDIEYELVATPPVYQKTGNVLLSSQHVRTVLYQPEIEKQKGIFILRGHVTIDYFPTRGTHRLRRVLEDEFFSLYYNNKAAEAIIKDENELAFWYLKKSLLVKKAGSQAINMMAVLHSRKGHYDVAEQLYLYGIENGEKTVEILKNYRSLLIKTKRLKKASEIKQMLAGYDDPDPFKWITLGNEDFEKGEYSSAISYFKKAARIAPYLHESHAGIGRSQYMLGNLRLAKKSIELALEKSHKQETTSIYKIKYDLLSKLIN